ncbi:MAG TPA: DUF3106 domain-containing protein [Terriglobia bacterium]
MRINGFTIGRGLALALAFAAGTVIGAAQGQQEAAHGQAAARAQASGPARQPGPTGEEKNAKALPPGVAGFVQHLQEMPLDQQETFLKNNSRFQSMPPERQQQVLEGLRAWNEADRPAGQLGGFIAQHTHPPGFFQKLRELPPDEQAKVLENDAHFQSLPPERQQQIRENLNRWNAATPAQKETLRQREEIVQGLSAAQRDRLREVFPLWRQLPEDRQQALMQAFRKLRDLPPAGREKFLASPEVQQEFSPEEREILSSLKSLLPQS